MRVAQREIAVSRREIHSGPLPHPRQLEEYDRVVPGAAERIIQMAETQSHHRQTLERKVINSRSRDSLLGIISAFIITMTIILLGGYIIVNSDRLDGQLIGTLLTGLGISGIVGTFIYGTRSARKEREEKTKQ